MATVELNRPNRGSALDLPTLKAVRAVADHLGGSRLRRDSTGSASSRLRSPGSRRWPAAAAMRMTEPL
jgi:hypothetical protein